MKTIIKQIWSMLDGRERRYLGKLAFLLAMVAGLELLGLSVIIGAIGAWTKKTDASWLNHFSDTGNAKAFLFTGLFIIVFFLAKHIVILSVQFTLLRYLINTELGLSRRLLTLYFNSRYDFIAMRNYAEILRNIISICSQCINFVLRPLLLIIADSTVAVCIVIFLFWFSPVPTLTLLLLVGSVTLTFFYTVKPRLRSYGRDLAESSADRLQWINQAFGSIKERSILNRNDYFIEGYQNAARRYSEANAGYAFISRIPISLIEIVLVTAILPIGMAVIFFEGGDHIRLTTIFGLFLGAAMRLVPAISAINNNMQMLQLQSPNLAVLHHEINQLKQNAEKKTRPDAPRLSAFTSSIVLDRISFKYQGSDALILNDVSLEIKKGESVAFIGSTGAGKTTIVDLIMGLIQPTEGRVLVDGMEVRLNPHEWQKFIGYVPQSIYLLDGSIRQNVAFAIEKKDIDDERIRQVLDMAQLSEFVGTLPDGLETRAGERGVRLSGGQQQRMNIARALYHNPDVLIFDEATAALDNVTEQEIVQSLEGLKHKKTLITIAHRLSTVHNCDRIFFLKDGRLAAVGAYDDLMNTNIEFRQFSEGKASKK